MFATKSCLIQEIWSSNNNEVAFDWQTRNNNVDLCLYVSKETFPAGEKIFPDQGTYPQFLANNQQV